MLHTSIYTDIRFIESTFLLLLLLLLMLLLLFLLLLLLLVLNPCSHNEAGFTAGQ